MNAIVTLQGWTMVIVWTADKKQIAFTHLEALSAKRYTLKDATLYVHDMIDEPIAKRTFLALLAVA